MKLSGKLDARKIPTLPLTDEGKVRSHSDGRGLVVIVEPAKGEPTRTWNYRFTFAGKPAILRMGHINDLSITEAREKAVRYRAMIVDGKDPRRVSENTAAGQQTFKAYADEHWADITHGKGQVEWRHALAQVAKLHARPIAEIELKEVHTAIKKYWNERPVTASRVVQKIFQVFEHARVNKLRMDNPAAVKDLYRLGGGVVPPRSVAPVEAHAALPFADLPAFMQRLGYETTISARCLEYCILTAARSQEAREARWTWLNDDMTTVTVPGEFMKAGKPHTVPLPTQVTKMLRALPQTGELIFPSNHTYENSKAMLPHALLNVAKKLAGDGISAHGFRSTFHDFCTVNGLEHDMVVEMSLAHVVGDQARRAYARDGLVDRRRPVMQAFADYATGAVPPANVVPFKSKVA